MKHTIIFSILLATALLTSCNSGENLSVEASEQMERTVKINELYENATTKIKFGASDEKTANLLEENPDERKMIGDSFFFVCDSDFEVEEYCLSSKLSKEEKSKIKLMQLKIEVSGDSDSEFVILYYFENFTFSDMIKYNSIGLTVKDGMYHFMFFPVEVIEGTKTAAPDFYNQFEKVTLQSASGEFFDAMFCPFSYIEETGEDSVRVLPIRKAK